LKFKLKIVVFISIVLTITYWTGIRF